MSAENVMDDDGYWYKFDIDMTKIYLCIVCRGENADYVHLRKAGVSGGRDPRLCYCSDPKTRGMTSMYKGVPPSERKRRHKYASGYGPVRRPHNAIVFPSEARVIAEDGRRFIRTYRSHPLNKKKRCRDDDDESYTSSCDSKDSKEDDDDDDDEEEVDARLRRACERCWRRATYICNEDTHLCAVHRVSGAKPLIRPCAVELCSHSGVEVITLSCGDGVDVCDIGVHRLCRLHSKVPIESLKLEVRRKRKRKIVVLRSSSSDDSLCGPTTAI